MQIQGTMLVSLLSSILVASAMLMESMPSSPYKSACVGQVGYLYSFQGYNCESLRSSKRVSCQCPNIAFAETIVSCIDQMVSEVSHLPQSSQDEARAQAYKEFAKTCPQYSLKELNTFRSNISSLPSYDESLKRNKKPGKYPASGPFALPRQEVIDSYNSLMLYNNSEYLNKKYGAVLVGYWGCIVAIKAILFWATKVFPLSMASISNSKVGRLYRMHMTMKHHAVLDYLGMTVWQFMVILGFMALLVPFTFANLPVYYPSYIWMNSNAATYGTIVGQRSGVLSLYMLPLLILFAGRNNFLQWLTGWSIGPYLTFHKWIARSVVFLLIVHTIGYSVGRACVGRYGEMWHKSYWNWGIVGLAFGCFLVFQGIRFIRNSAYDVFVVLHIIGVILFLVGGYYHLKILEEPIGLYFYYACFAVWGLDRALRLVRVLSSGAHKKASTWLIDDTLVVLIEKPEHWNLIEYPGRHVFIHFWKVSLFWQSHPFTIVGHNSSPKYLKLFCKVHNGATKQIAKSIMTDTEHLKDNYAQVSDRESEKMGSLERYHSSPSLDQFPKSMINVLLDGPYGHVQDLFEFDDCIFIAGGTGITPILGYIQNSLYKYQNRLQKIKLYWAVKEERQIELCFEEELNYLKEIAAVEVNIFSSKSKRLDVSTVIQEAVVNTTGPLAVMCCGPPRMTATAGNAIASSLQQTNHYVEYFEQLVKW